MRFGFRRGKVHSSWSSTSSSLSGENDENRTQGGNKCKQLVEHLQGDWKGVENSGLNRDDFEAVALEQIDHSSPVEDA